MSYIIIEVHSGPEYAIIVIDEDGNNKIFNTEEVAQMEADDWQDAIVVCIA